MRVNNIEIRSAAAPSVSGRRVSGTAAVFNSPSQVLFEGNRRFIEIILPGAIDEALIQRSDVKALVDHNRERLLARSNKGKGTLSLRITSTGLMYSFDAPHTADGDFAVEMVRRGDVDGSSFAFSVADGGDIWEKRQDGVYLRKIKKISGLYDVTVTASPAYPQTSVGVRHRIDGTKDNDHRKKLHALAKKAGIPWTPAEKIKALRDELDRKTRYYD
jgi:hypothetical protein